MDYKADRKGDLLDTLGGIFVDNSDDIYILLSSVFNQIISYYNIERGLIRIHYKGAGEIFVDIHHGYSEEEVSSGLYKSGDGIINSVLKTGNPYILIDVLNEPGFISRVSSGRYAVANKISFICVPIKLGKLVIGTISVDIINNYGRELDDELRILKTVSIMIAQAVQSRIQYMARENLLKEEIRLLRNRIEIGSLQGKLIGRSSAMKPVFSGIITAAESDANVLITGGSGTGRGLIAEQIHSGSKRSDKPFVKFNAAAYTPPIAESVLFGGEESSAARNEPAGGLIEASRGGALVLQNIHSMSGAAQSRLAEAVRSRSVVIDGAVKPVDVRIILISGEMPQQKGAVEEAVLGDTDAVIIHSPELRERKSDILLLANYFLEQYSKKSEKYVKRISPGAVELLTAYHWPGNVSELRDCIEKGVDLCEEGVIRGFHLPLHLQASDEAGGEGTLEERTDLFEREIITDALKVSGGNITVAARRLGSTKRILGYKIEKLGIDYRAFRNSDR